MKILSIGFIIVFVVFFVEFFITKKFDIASFLFFTLFYIALVNLIDKENERNK
jgi:hypothetical protein